MSKCAQQHNVPLPKKYINNNEREKEEENNANDDFNLDIIASGCSPECVAMLSKMI